VYIKSGANTPAATASNPPRAPRALEPSRQTSYRAAQAPYDDNSMQIDQTAEDDGPYRDEEYEKVPPTQPRRAEPSFEDGRYGFGNDSTTSARVDDRGYGDSDNKRYDDRSRSNRGYSNRGDSNRGDRTRGGQNSRYRQDNGARGGQGRLASDSMLGRR
jgi:hypothetical protein